MKTSVMLIIFGLVSYAQTERTTIQNHPLHIKVIAGSLQGEFITEYTRNIADDLQSQFQHWELNHYQHTTIGNWLITVSVPNSDIPSGIEIRLQRMDKSGSGEYAHPTSHKYHEGKALRNTTYELFVSARQQIERACNLEPGSLKI